MSKVRIPYAATDASSSAGSPFGWSSTNWSGYAVTTSKNRPYTGVSAEWRVPPVTAPLTAQQNPFPNPFGIVDEMLGLPVGSTSGQNAYSATWIGIDGFNNGHLIQTGTAQNVVDGKPQYYAWWEIIPKAEVPLDSKKYPVFAGDVMHAKISRSANGKWRIRLRNRTQQWTFTIRHKYNGPGTSAEWIEEAPEIGSQISNLANYHQVTFAKCMVSGKNADLHAAEGGVMYTTNRPISTPSLPGPSRNAFRVAYGPYLPMPPVS